MKASDREDAMRAAAFQDMESGAMLTALSEIQSAPIGEVITLSEAAEPHV